MAKTTIRNESGVPFSRWKPADKFAYVMRTDYPLMFQWCVPEFEFHNNFKWRHDFAWPAYLIACEIDGFGFGHQAQQQMAADNEKANLAVLAGWRVFRFNSRQLGSRAGVDDAVAMVWGCICDFDVGSKLNG